VHPIAAVQMEYSLWTRDPEAEVLPACRELGVGFVAYSPLGRGFLTGQFAGTEALAADDIRRSHPRFQDGNLQQNQAIAQRVHATAERLGATPAQVALRWLLGRGHDIVPIPGTRRPERLAENVAALTEPLPEADAAALTGGLPPAAGARYPEASLAALNG
jgi:aryl-alcohol dehydrogenase-like predicted oxidoreductase